jgi:rhamnogalacturonan hydrolase
MGLGILSISGTSFIPALVTAQPSARAGPATTREAKMSKKICNVLDYGAVASKTIEIGPRISFAFAACKNGGTGISISGSHWE